MKHLLLHKFAIISSHLLRIIRYYWKLIEVTRKVNSITISSSTTLEGFRLIGELGVDEILSN